MHSPEGDVEIELEVGIQKYYKSPTKVVANKKNVYYNKINLIYIFFSMAWRNNFPLKLWVVEIRKNRDLP